jgi:hypothetical protein
MGKYEIPLDLRQRWALFQGLWGLASIALIAEVA